mgnify:FL=1
MVETSLDKEASQWLKKELTAQDEILIMNDFNSAQINRIDGLKAATHKAQLSQERPVTTIDDLSPDQQMMHRRNFATRSIQGKIEGFRDFDKMSKEANSDQAYLRDETFRTAEFKHDDLAQKNRAGT